MNHDELKFGLIPLPYPCIYFGLAAFYSYFYFLFLAVSVCLFPALIGVWLIKVRQRWFADHSPTQE